MGPSQFSGPRASSERARTSTAAGIRNLFASLKEKRSRSSFSLFLFDPPRGACMLHLIEGLRYRWKLAKEGAGPFLSEMGTCGGHAIRSRTGIRQYLQLLWLVIMLVPQVGGLAARMPFSRRENHPASFQESSVFLGIGADGVDGNLVGARRRLDDDSWAQLQLQLHSEPRDHTETTLRRVAVALSKQKAIDVKEFMEATEFYLRTRKRVRRTKMLDLACGHGLAGLCFAAFEKSVERVHFMDQRCPASYHKALAAFGEVAPWVSDKVEFLECDLFDPSSQAAVQQQEAPAGEFGAIAIHACGGMTDRCLEIAVSLNASLAAMPCCYTGTAKHVPLGVRRALGVSMAADVDRSYRLSQHGYHVDWASIPRSVTPMNRILIASPSTSPAAKTIPPSER